MTEPEVGHDRSEENLDTPADDTQAEPGAEPYVDPDAEETPAVEDFPKVEDGDES
jgi:hypothetical protein